MARSRRAGGGARRAPPSRPVSRPASTYSRPAAPPATRPPQSSAPAASSGGGGMLSGIGSTIAQGMAFGTGSAMAHRAVGAVAGSFGGGGEAQQEAPAPEYAAGAMNTEHQQSATGGACGQDKEMFYECLKHNKGDQEACNFLYQQLQQCQQSSTQMQFN